MDGKTYDPASISNEKLVELIQNGDRGLIPQLWE